MVIKKKKVFIGLIIALIIISALFLYSWISSIISPDIEDVRTKIADYLYDKYGEEFVVEQIGTRTAYKDHFYEARIYPKSLIGTKKEGDSYYYGSASVSVESFGRLGGVGDSYPLVNLKVGIEEYLKPEAAKIFGDRIMMDIEAHYKRREPGNETFWGYKVKSFEAARKEIAKDPENRMIELTLYLYIFDRIDNDKEKEERRQQIFDFVQYLKQEGLFRYLEMGVIFIDERVLAPSYRVFRSKIYQAPVVEQRIGTELVRFPPMELRNEMSSVLKDEVDNMNENELLMSMYELTKNNLVKLSGYNASNVAYIYSLGIIEKEYLSSLTEKDKKRDYSVIDDVIISKNLKNIYTN